MVMPYVTVFGGRRWHAPVTVIVGKHGYAAVR